MIIQDKGACTYGPVQCTTIQMPYRWYRSQYTYERFRSKQQDWSNYYIFCPRSETYNRGPASPLLGFYSITVVAIVSPFNNWTVTHPSANRGPNCLTSEIFWELVFPLWFKSRVAEPEPKFETELRLRFYSKKGFKKLRKHIPVLYYSVLISNTVPLPVPVPLINKFWVNKITDARGLFELFKVHNN